MSDSVSKALQPTATPAQLDGLKQVLATADKLIQHWEAIKDMGAAQGMSIEKITAIRDLTSQLIAVLQS